MGRAALFELRLRLSEPFQRRSRDGQAINFETLKASLVLYGLNAIYAALLLVLGWYLSGLAERFVNRLLKMTCRVDPLITVFAGSFARYAVLAVVRIAVLQLFVIQTASSSPS
jgi:small conductance mechanosensitive channel